MSRSTCISSSGKVLTAGGYLVLDPAYSGVVVSTSSRFYVVVTDGSDASQSRIRVTSPQFLEAVWTYSADLSGPKVIVEPVDASSKNKFVHLALQYTLALVQEIRGTEALSSAIPNGLDIVIAGDNDFYSQREYLESKKLPRTTESLQKIPPFNPTNVKIADVHKTGLGSSAALITSLVSALLSHLSAVEAKAFQEEAVSDGRRLAHNLAQFVHCLAQGKVGSGFDVSAAVFGSQLYTRFDPKVIAGLMTEQAAQSQKLLPILQASNKEWTHVVKPFKLPPQTRLLLADVDAGSDTPSLVGKVLKWRSSNPTEAKALWTSLDQSNMNFAKSLNALTDLESQDSTAYSHALQTIASTERSQWPLDHAIFSQFHAVYTHSEDIRKQMRQMGTLCDVPIEPAEQTRLLDACLSETGIIAGGVPGAGGYDALWLLVAEPSASNSPSPVGRIEKLWSSWKELDVSPLSASESAVKGARLEDITSIAGLAALVQA